MVEGQARPSSPSGEGDHPKDGGGARSADPKPPKSVVHTRPQRHEEASATPKRPISPPLREGPGLGVRRPKPCASSHPGTRSVFHAETAEGRGDAERVEAVVKAERSFTGQQLAQLMVL